MSSTVIADESTVTMQSLLAMAKEGLDHGKKQAHHYMKGTMTSGDTIKGEGAAAPFEGQVETLGFAWAHVKVVSKETSKSAIPTQVGMVIVIPMNNSGIVLLHQALYKGSTVEELDINFSEFSEKGKMSKFGTVACKKCRVADVIYDGYSSVGPVAYVCLIMGSHEITVGNKSAKWNHAKNDDS
jgi:type VI protein secretion system component Hcp